MAIDNTYGQVSALPQRPYTRSELMVAAGARAISDGAGGGRERGGLPRGGPSTVIPTLGLMRFDPDSKEMILVSIHPGVTVDMVLDSTGWALRPPPNVTQTPAPAAAELAMLRRFDPEGYWTGD